MSGNPFFSQRYFSTRSLHSLGRRIVITLLFERSRELPSVNSARNEKGGASRLLKKEPAVSAISHWGCKLPRPTRWDGRVASFELTSTARRRPQGRWHLPPAPFLTRHFREGGGLNGKEAEKDAEPVRERDAEDSRSACGGGIPRPLPDERRVVRQGSEVAYFRRADVQGLYQRLPPPPPHLFAGCGGGGKQMNLRTYPLSLIPSATAMK